MLNDVFWFLADLGIRISNFLGMGYIQTVGFVFTGIIPAYFVLMFGIGIYRRLKLGRFDIAIDWICVVLRLKPRQSEFQRQAIEFLTRQLGNPEITQGMASSWSITSGFDLVAFSDRKAPDELQIWLPYDESIQEDLEIEVQVFEPDSVRPAFTYQCVGMSENDRAVRLKVEDLGHLSKLEKYLFHY